MSDKRLVTFLKFINKRIIILTEDDYNNIYTVPIKNPSYDEIKKYKKKTKSERYPDHYHIYKIHVMIIKYFKDDGNVWDTIKKFIDEYDLTLPQNDFDIKIIRELNYFVLGNKKKLLKKKQTNESIRLALHSILLTYEGFSVKLSENIPIIGYCNGRLLDVVHIIKKEDTKKNVLVAASKTTEYSYSGLVFNAMYYKIKLPEYKPSDINIEKNKKIDMLYEAAETKIKSFIDVLSLSEDPNNVYYAIQLISNMFEENTISKVIDKLIKK